MIWRDAVGGQVLTQDALPYISKWTPQLGDLACPAGTALPGIERGDHHTLGCALIEWVEDGGISLSQETQAQLSQGTGLLFGLAEYAMAQTQRLLNYADVAVSMNLEAIRGEMGAFDAHLHDIARPFPGQISSAANVRRLVEGSDMVTDKGRFAFGYDKAPRVQDAICVRATPQTHGGARDFATFAYGQLAKDVAEGNETLDRTEYALTGLITALADLAHISERRTFRLNDTHLSYGLPMNLVLEGAGLNHGYPVVQCTQAALVAELKLLTLPAQLLRVEEESVAYFSICKLLKAIDLAEHVLAVEILMSCQGMDIVARKVPELHFAPATTAVLSCLRRRVTVLEENRFMAPDMMAALELLQQGNLLAAAESVVGTLQ